MTKGTMKVVTVVGTRPEIIRLSRVLTLLDRETSHILVHTGQNYDYELNEIFFRDLELRKPDYFLEAAAGTAAETVGKVIAGVDGVLAKEQPEALLILGDTNSALAAYPAKRRKIPVFHMEAGNRCFDERVPEEINRRIVDHISDINMPYSDIAREYLLREGLPPDRIIKTGSPMLEVLAHNKAAIERSCILEQLALTEQGYFLVSAHREENIEDQRHYRSLVGLLDALADEYRLPLVVSTHPRTRKKIEEQGGALSPLVQFLKPFGYHDYVKLQMHARVVFSDSGTIMEEASLLNFPAVTIREAHERPEGMEEGAVMMVGLKIERALQAVAILSRQGRGGERTLAVVSDYNVPNVSEKVLRIIMSYTDYIKRTVWHEQ